MYQVFLLLGSNMGDRYLFIRQAVDYVAADIAPITQASSVYESQSWGKTDAPDYLNQVVVVRTAEPPRLILQKILAIENRLGRLRGEKWGPRTIDIDILFYGQEIVDGPGLQIPHPEVHNRRFTLEPLSEIAPDWVHPVLKTTINSLKTELFDDLNVKRCSLEIFKPYMSQNSLPQDLDLSFLYDIADGSTEFIVESIDMFLQQTPELLQMISKGIQEEDWATVTGAAHKLKPNCGFFGMPICQATIQEVELMAKEDVPNFQLIQAKYEEVRSVLDENLKSLVVIKAEKEAEL